MLETVTPFGWTLKTLWWNENDRKVVVLYLWEASPSFTIFSCCYLDEWHFRLIITLNVVLALITWGMIVSCIRYCTPVSGYVDSKSIHWDCVKGKGLKGGATKADGSLEFFAQRVFCWTSFSDRSMFYSWSILFHLRCSFFSLFFK